MSRDFAGCLDEYVAGMLKQPSQTGRSYAIFQAVQRTQQSTAHAAGTPRPGGIGGQPLQSLRQQARFGKGMGRVLAAAHVELILQLNAYSLPDGMRVLYRGGNPKQLPGVLTSVKFPLAIIKRSMRDETVEERSVVGTGGVAGTECLRSPAGRTHERSLD